MKKNLSFLSKDNESINNNNSIIKNSEIDLHDLNLKKNNFNEINNIQIQLKNGLIGKNISSSSSSNNSISSNENENKKEKKSNNTKNSKIKKNSSILSTTKNTTINNNYNSSNNNCIIISSFIKEKNYRQLQKKKLIYDSLDDEEFDDEQIDDNFFIHPKGKFKLILDFVIYIISIYDVITNPFYLGYYNYNYNCNSSNLNLKNFITFSLEIIYIIDFLSNFFLAFFNFEEILITDSSLIIINYLTSWLFPDLICAIPVGTICLLTIENCNRLNYAYNNMNNHHIFLFLTCFRQIKIFKIRNSNVFYKKINKFLNTYYEKFNLYGNIYLTFFIFVIALNYISCIFIFIGKNSYPNWLLKNDLNNTDFIHLYITAIYYVITTLTTVGYGDITNYNMNERIFELFLLIVGIIAYSYIISSISNYIKNIDDRNVQYENKMSVLEDIKLTHPKLSDDLYERIVRYLKYKDYYDKSDMNIVFESLPLKLRNSLVCNMYKNIIDNFIFFKNFDNNDFIVRVVLSFNPILAIKNDILVQEGEFIEEIIFVKKGKLCLEIPINLNENPLLVQYNFNKNLTNNTKVANITNSIINTKNDLKSSLVHNSNILI